MNLLLFPAVLIFSIGISCSSKSPGQDAGYFEGTITYKGNFVRKTEKYDSVTLAAIAGDEAVYHFKEGNYLTELSKGIATWMLYRKADNKIYRETFKSDTVYWMRSDKPGPKILKFTKHKNVEQILGINCDELKIFYENRSVTFYYNADTLKMNPDWTKNTTAYNEDFVARETKSTVLKTIIEYEDFIITQTAVKIAPEKIDDTIFEIPHKPLVEDN